MNYIRRFFVVIALYIMSLFYPFIYGLLKDLLLSSSNSMNYILGSFVIAISIILNIGLVFYFAKNLGFIGFDKEFFTKRNFALIFLGFILLRMIAYIGYLILENQGGNATINDQLIWKTFSQGNPIITVLMMAIAAPIMEEIIFRGAIINYWLKDFPIIGVLVSSIIFASLHSTSNITSYLIYFFMGFVLAILFFKTKRIEVSIGAHILNNLLPAISIIFSL